MPVGVIGSGSFGTAIANLLAYNDDVFLYSRREEVVRAINQDKFHLGTKISPRITATTDLEHLASKCRLIFPVVPSDSFRSMMRDLGPFLRPSHIIIHGTKGFDLNGMDEEKLRANELKLNKNLVYSMSEVVKQESAVVRVGCLSGPNLASEIMAGQPTATLVGSRFHEVIDAGKKALASRQFFVFGSYDLLGAELAGALKNIIAIGSGICGGLGLGRNVQGLLISRGLTEMMHFGKAMGSDSSAFLGVAGVGDLVTTATSTSSRNYTFGTRLAKGESLEDIQKTMPELAEGVRTLLIAKRLAKTHKLRVPITTTLYSVIFESMEIEKAVRYLMAYRYSRTDELLS